METKTQNRIFFWNEGIPKLADLNKIYFGHEACKLCRRLARKLGIVLQEFEKTSHRLFGESAGGIDE